MSAEPHMAPAPAPAKDHTALNTTSSPSPHHNTSAGAPSTSTASASATGASNVGPGLATPSSPGRQTHEQLAQLLAKAYSDIDNLHRDLSQTKRRAEQAERVAQRLTAVAEASPNATAASTNGNGNANQGVIPESVTRIIRELEDRLTHSELAREDAEARRRFVMDQWIQVENYLNQLEVKAQEAKFGFMRVLREGVPVSLSPAQSNLHAPSHPQGVRRPRTPSLEGNYPPPKRSRGNDGHGREPRIAYSESNIHDYNRHHHHHHPSTSSTGHPPQQPQQHHVRVIHQPGARPRSTSRSSTSSIDVDEMLLQATDDSHPHPNGVANIPGGQLQAQASQHITSGHRSRSGRQSTLRVAEGEMHQHGVQGGVYMTGRRGAQPGGSGGMEVYPASQSVPRQGSLGVGMGVPGGQGGIVGGQQQVYQTHIFAPPVTGAPVKKSKYGSGGSGGVTGDAPSGSLAGSASSANIAASSASLLASSLTSSASTAAIGAGAANANSVLSGPNFPPTNEQGQRICRQCGQAGRYKDGKCVEKWGPGPAGPGTVCDRCRKKMKRVERRGTLESQQQLAAAHLAAVNVHPHHGSMGPPVQHQPTQHHTGLTRTDTLPTSAAASANTSANTKGSSKVSHVRTIMHASASPAAPASSSKREKESRGQQGTASGRGRTGNNTAPSSRGAAAATTNAAPTATNNGNDNNKMQLDNNVSGESDADADADGDGEGDLDGGDSIVVPANATLPFKRPGGVAVAAEAEEEEEDVDDLVGEDDSGEGDDADAEAEILEAVDAAEESG